MADLRKKYLPALCALLCLALLAACGGGGETTDESEDESSIEVSRDPVLLPADARKIVEDLNAGSVKANATLDENLQNSIETSPARDVDDAFFKRFRALGRTTATGPARNLQDVTTYVPRQTTYPARFMAYVKLPLADDPAQPPTTRLRLFEKADADEPWKLAMYISVPPEFSAPDVPVDADGFAEMVSEDDAENLKLDPAQVPEELSRYLSGYGTTLETSVFAPGRYTTELAQSYKTSAEEDAQAEITSSTEVKPGDLDAQAFKLRDGGALTLFSTEAVTTFTAPEGKSLNPTAGSEGLLPSGRYTTIKRTTAHMVAAVVPPADAEGMVQIVGNTSGVVAFEHTP